MTALDPRAQERLDRSAGGGTAGRRGGRGRAAAPGDGPRTAEGAPPSILAVALAYAGRGWPVHPLVGKRATLPDWPNAASTDADALRAWWSRTPNAGVGIVTGVRSGLVVLDVDPRAVKHGSPLTPLEERVGPLPGTAMVRTGGGGLHLLYRHPGGRVPCRTAVLPGLDVKADGGYVVAPPSVHPDTGRIYEWHGGLPDLGDLALWPVAQLAPVLAPVVPVQRVGVPVPLSRSGGAPAALVGLVRTVLEAPEGQRNDRLFWAACRAAEHAAAGGLDLDGAFVALDAAGADVGLPGWERTRTLASARSRGAAA